jgi:Tfp pilus assembly protein PilO
MKLDFSQTAQMLNKLDINIRYGIFIAILLIILVLDFFIIIMPLQLNPIRKLDSDRQTLQQNIEKLKSDWTRIDQIKVSLQKNRMELEALNSKIRPVGEIPSILEDMSRLANDVGVKIDQITPQPDAQKILVSSDSGKYYLLPIVIQASSGYHMFGRFLNRLELGKLLFIVQSLSIENKADEGKDHIISATLKVVVYEKNLDGPQK